MKQHKKTIRHPDRNISHPRQSSRAKRLPELVKTLSSRKPADVRVYRNQLSENQIRVKTLINLAARAISENLKFDIWVRDPPW